MHLARVIGTVWATRKDPSLTGASLLLLQPMGPEGGDEGKPLVAADNFRAGPGERVLYVTAREAVLAYAGDLNHLTPVDAAVVGIVEQLGDDGGSE